MKAKKQHPNTSSKQKNNGSQKNRFPVVCIGASAGGLEALEQFLGNVPDNSGLGYVVIQHLDPTQKGMLPELLQRITKMKVSLVKDRMLVKPDNVYVIPPNKSMSIFKGRLHLFEPTEARGMRLPIDFFLQSLADDLKEFGIGVILSGMGSDGSSGLRAIKEKNGVVLVQQPETAKFNSMPRNAIDSVLADIVAPPNELPTRLIEFLKHIPVVKSTLEPEVKDKSALEKIIILLRTFTGNDFSLYKKNTMYRRIERRMGIHKIDKIASYVHFLQENPKEGDILYKELMIGVTSFFRDPEVWEKLKDDVLPKLISGKSTGTLMRAWVPGCSTGEEAYSLAIVFKEAMEKINTREGISLQIFATDLDSDAIEKARKGVFNENIVAEVSPDRLKRFFFKTEEGYRINTEIREMIVFAQHNTIMHPPFTKIDILSCRNLLIYMDTSLQKKLLGLFYYSINPEGIMLLGSSETLGMQSHLFSSLDTKLKIFRRAYTTLTPDVFDFPSSFARFKPANTHEPMPVKSTENIQALADQILLQQFSPVGVLVNENGDIIYACGRTGKYLEPAVGKANLNIFAMLREGLQHEFPLAFRKAVTRKEKVELRHIKVGANSNSQIIDIDIQWIDKPTQLKGTVMVIFSEIKEETTTPEKGNKKSSDTYQSELEEELRRSREEMQNTFEEMQTSQEELKSTNEELQSTNEELQSTNEELTSSKEEMQSLNEELQTVNAELQAKVDDYSRVNNDMKNLLNSTDIATLFLDKELNIRRFTDQVTKIFKLIKSDIGRPLTDQVTDLIYPDLATDAREVLRTLIFIEKQIPTKDDRWFSTRIMPYRTFDDRIDGLVVTFINITDLKNLEAKLNETENMNHLFLNASSDIFVKLSADGIIQELNAEAEKFFGVKRKGALNQNFIQLLISGTEQKRAKEEINKLLKKGKQGKFKTKVLTADNAVAAVDCSVHILTNNDKLPSGIILIEKHEKFKS